jgi:hypothetical protein
VTFFVFMVCTNFLTVHVNGVQLSCNPGEVNYYPAAKELRIGSRIIAKPELTQYPGRLIITGTEILFRSGFE